MSEVLTAPLSGLNRENIVAMLANKIRADHAAFGKQLVISPKAHAELYGGGEYRICFFKPVVQVTIGIGDHTGYLIMDRDAWEKFKDGEQVKIDTIKQFREKSRNDEILP